MPYEQGTTQNFFHLCVLSALYVRTDERGCPHIIPIDVLSTWQTIAPVLG